MQLWITLISTLTLAILAGCDAGPEESQPTPSSATSPTKVTGSSRQVVPTTDIFEAVLKNQPKVVKQHIAAGTDLNAQEPNGGTTALNLACVLGHDDIAKLLIDAGAHLEIKNNEGATPLFNAAFFCHPDIVKSLLSKGAAVNTTNKDGLPLVDIMEGEWGPGLEGVYRAVFSALQIQRDINEVKRTRPVIAGLLRERVKGTTVAERPMRTTPVRPASEIARVRKNLPPITAADWASYNHDVAGWRFNSAEKTLTAKNAAQLEEKWRFPAKGSAKEIGVIHATPTVVNGHVYFGTGTYPAFYKLKPNGTIAWVYQPKASRASRDLPRGGVNTIAAESGIMTSALVTRTGVYFGDSAGVFFALDRVTGEELWKVDTRAAGFPNHHAINIFNASAILADGKVIVGGGGYEHPYPLDPDYECCTGRGFVVAFDPANGDVVWKYEVGEEPQKFPEPIAMTDDNGKHLFTHGPSTSSVWSTPSYDKETGTILFGTDVHNSPRQPTDNDPRLYTKYSAAVIAVDVRTGKEKWVTQLNKGDIFNHAMSGYDPKTGRYKDCSIGDTPKVYSVTIDGQLTKVVGVGCKNGGFYCLRASDGAVLASTPTFAGRPRYPLEPKREPRMVALPSPIGGIQTGCATDGKSVVTNGIDWLMLNTKSPGRPEGGRVVSLTGDLAREIWRHERPKSGRFIKSGDPVGAGIALGGGVCCFTTTVSRKLVVLDTSSGGKLKEIDIGTVWSGPSISRGRIYVGTGSILFLEKQIRGTLYSFGLPGDDEIDRLGAGNE